MRNLICFILAAMVFTGCSSPDLEVAQSRSKVTLQGEFLTENPDTINFPIRIVLAIDCSGSMAGSDPDHSRIDAAWDFINTYHEYESVKFDIIHWSNSVRGTTGGFTRDLDELNNVLYNYDNTSTTNYLTAIQTAQNHFLQEIAEMENDDAQSANIARMKGIVLFFSDGLPDPGGVTIYNQIDDAIETMHERLVDEEGIAKLNFHTFFLSTLLQGNQDAYNEAVDLLTNMANQGNGRFTEFTDSSAIDFINIVDMRLTVEYRVKFIVAYNANVKPGTEIVHLDSDGDGLTDAQEDKNGNGIVDLDPVTGLPTETDPRVKDSDGDGLSDYLEVKLGAIDNALSPLDPTDSGCPFGTEDYDRDRDGLTDCEEFIKGTKYNIPDTDFDGIPDGIEFYMGTNPLEAQYSADTDFDGVSDWIEVQRHTNIGINDEKIRERYSYHYDIADQGVIVLNQGTEHESIRRRISFDISNIDIMPTLETNTRNAGDNLIRLFIAEVPEDMPESNPVYRVADIIVNTYSRDSRTIIVDSFEAL